MKKLSSLATVFFFLFLTFASANAYSVYLGLDDKVVLEAIHGFECDVMGLDVNDLSFTVYHQPDTVIVDGISMPGAVPAQITDTFPWDIAKTTKGVFGFDYSYGSFPLTPGIILSLEGTSTFTLSNFFLANNDDPMGKYPYPFFVLEDEIEDGRMYTYSVPIPGTLLLLGSGLFALYGIYRRRIS